MNNRKKILLLGAGALGVYFTSRLSLNNLADIIVAARSDYETLKRQGYYQINSAIYGEYKFTPSHILRLGEPLPIKPDYILVCFKATSGFNQAELCRYVMDDETPVLVIENGLAPEASLVKNFPNAEINSAVAFVGVSRPASGVVQHFDSGKITCGPARKGIDPSSKLLELAELFQTAGIPTEVTDNMPLYRWNKLLWNTPFNPICVLANNADTQQVMHSPELKCMVYKIMLELCEIAKAEGVELSAEAPQQMLEFTENFSAYKPSMLQDFCAGRNLEVEGIIGDPLRCADAHGIEAPYLRAVYALIKLASRPGYPIPGKERTIPLTKS